MDDLGRLVSHTLEEVAQALGVPRKTLPIEAQQAVTRAIYEAHRRGIRGRRRRSSSMSIPTVSDND